MQQYLPSTRARSFFCDATTANCWTALRCRMQWITNTTNNPLTMAKVYQSISTVKLNLPSSKIPSKTQWKSSTRTCSVQILYRLYVGCWVFHDLFWLTKSITLSPRTPKNSLHYMIYTIDSQTLSEPSWIRPLTFDWKTVFPNGVFVLSRR